MHVDFTYQYCDYVYFVTIATELAHHKQTTISLTFPTNVNFPDFSGFSKFSMCVATSYKRLNRQ